jgi:hypothetical protein
LTSWQFKLDVVKCTPLQTSSGGETVFEFLLTKAFNQSSKISENASENNEVHLNCPFPILQTFRNLMKENALLGTTFHNPYTRTEETFPKNVEELTARHLQILSRCENENTSGIMRTDLYQGNLTDDQIAKLRCLVKATTIAGKVTARQSGGFNSGQSTPLATPEKIILIDQPGIQWQGDFRNTGGMFFYPADPKNLNLPQNYTAWQNDAFKSMYGYQRPEKSDNLIPVKWKTGSKEAEGKLDLNLVANAIAVEFRQAFDAVAAQSNSLEKNQPVNFKFLKAGMGFFAEGIIDTGNAKTDPIRIQLEHARLKGILAALRQIQSLPENERKDAIAKIARIELPFSDQYKDTVFKSTLDEIKTAVEKLGLSWGGAPNQDVFTPCEGYVNACTNCGDPHAMIGNEGGYTSVDAMISSNADVNHLNAGYNSGMTLRESPFYKPSSIPSPIVMSTTAPHPQSALDYPNLFSKDESKNSEALKSLLSNYEKYQNPGDWNAYFAADDFFYEIGIGKSSKNRAIATPDYQIELKDNELVVLDKNNQFKEVKDPAKKNQIISQLLSYANPVSVQSSSKKSPTVVAPKFPPNNNSKTNITSGPHLFSSTPLSSPFPEHAPFASILPKDKSVTLNFVAPSYPQPAKVASSPTNEIYYQLNAAENRIRELFQIIEDIFQDWKTTTCKINSLDANVPQQKSSKPTLSFEFKQPSLVDLFVEHCSEQWRKNQHTTIISFKFVCIIGPSQAYEPPSPR